jgi:hypothetical protein
MAEDHPRPLGRGHRVGHRPNDCHFLELPAEGQQTTLILQQHHRTLRGPARRGAMVGACDNLRQQRFIHIRALEQPHLDLERQDRAHQLLDLGHGQRALFHQHRHMIGIGVAGHVHVHPGFDAAQCSIAPIAGMTLNDHVADGERVRHHEAREAPFLAQDLAQQEAVAARRDIVEIHVGAHKGGRARLDRRGKGRQVGVAQLAFGEVDRVVVAPALRRAIAGEVLGAGQHPLRVGVIVALEAAHLSGRHRRAQVGVFARAFDNTPPARIAGNVEHRGEGPVEAGSAGFSGRHGLRLLRHGRIPGRGHRQWHGEDGAVAVDHIQRKQQGDAGRAFLDRQLL